MRAATQRRLDRAVEAYIKALDAGEPISIRAAARMYRTTEQFITDELRDRGELRRSRRGSIKGVADWRRGHLPKCAVDLHELYPSVPIGVIRSRFDISERAFLAERRRRATQ